ncbi:MAG: tRNA 2-selenouridine(34) synthase MnmH [Gammaproteobacteria bacterium]|nr:MAG: tRNA 2-selenouridine(34) synthase MnmH [Gammaproteobacteria bacterium]
MVVSIEKDQKEHQQLNYQQIFTEKKPLLDLRAPVEFAQGAFSQAINYPLMNDDERAQVGTCYKQQGQAAAIKLGHQLVSGHTKEQRLAQWIGFCEHNPEGVIYCFRGGLRSQTVQQWLKDCGIEYSIVQGGYKALRGFLLKQIDNIAKHPLVLLAGNTGSGKTTLLAHCPNSLDLEGAAHHRGSSFGSFVDPQSTQINFENRLTEQYLSRKFSSVEQNIVLEDEGRLIGNVHLPFSLVAAMENADVVVVEQCFEHRIERLLAEYVIEMFTQFCQQKGIEQGTIGFSDYLTQGLYRIRKRLGSQRYIALSTAMKQALSSQIDDNMRGHLNWLAPLLTHYYDPMYQYQLTQKQQRIVFRGDPQQCIDYLQSI